MDLKKLEDKEAAKLARQWMDYNPNTGEIKLRGEYRECMNLSAYYAHGYLHLRVNGYEYKAHRIAWLIYTGAWPNVIDHKNRIRDDNRICNLRDGDALLNMKNKSMYKRNSSGKTGVYFHKSTGRWRAMIRSEGVLHSLGLYKDFDDAVKARIEGEKRFGFVGGH